MSESKRRWLGPIAWALATWALVTACVLLSDALHPDAAHGLAVPHYSQAYSRAAIRAVAKRAGYGKANTAALVELARLESRWHNWSVSRGGACLGLFQLARSMCKGHPWWSPSWSTRRAITYIRHRYGTPLRALAFHRKHGWY